MASHLCEAGNLLNDVHSLLPRNTAHTDLHICAWQHRSSKVCSMFCSMHSPAHAHMKTSCIHSRALTIRAIATGHHWEDAGSGACRPAGTTRSVYEAMLTECRHMWPNAWCFHLARARLGFWKANRREKWRGSDSMGSQGLVRQLFRPRYLAKRCLAGNVEGVSICTCQPFYNDMPAASHLHSPNSHLLHHQ